MGINLSGLATGIDTNTIVAQLMAIERQPRQKLVLRQDQVTARENALKDIIAKLNALKTAATDLRSTSVWASVQTATSSDSTKVAVASAAGAAAGGYVINVTSLAVAEQHVYTYTSRPNPSSITIGATTVNLAQNATVQDAMNATNAVSTLNVTASVSNSQLVLTSKTTGTAGGFSASGQPIVEDTTKRQWGADAQFTVNGVAKTSPTNTNVTNAILGLSLNLQSTTPGGGVTITVGQSQLDQNAVKAKVKAFVDAYNSMVDLVRSKLDEKRDPKATSGAAATRGALFADPTLASMLGKLRQAFTDVVAGNPTTTDEMREIGISTGATTGGSAFSKDAVAGKLVIDDAVLTTALTNNPSGVQQLLGAKTGVDGFAQRMEGLLANYAQAGGVLDARITSADSELKRIADQLARFDARLARREKYLRAQFDAMESLVSSSQSMGSALSGQISALTSSTQR
jgi:flagellar hook-associated protein 2